VLRINKALQKLDLCDNNQLKDDGIAELAAGLESNTTLLELQLAACGIAVAGGAALGRALSANKALQKLILLNNSGMKDEGVEALAAGLKDNGTLFELRLRHCGIAAAGAAALGNALRTHKAMQKLILYQNREIKGAGVMALAKGLNGNSTLALLNLRDCGLTQAEERESKAILQAGGAGPEVSFT